MGFVYTLAVEGVSHVVTPPSKIEYFAKQVWLEIDAGQITVVPSLSEDEGILATLKCPKLSVGLAPRLP